MPEILEMSGLDDPGDNKGSGIGTILVFAGIAYALKLLADFLSKDEKSPAVNGVDIGSLGVIKRCRACDMKSGRPKRDQVWCLWDTKGKRILGRHPTRNRALKQEHLIQWKKNK